MRENEIKCGTSKGETNKRASYVHMKPEEHGQGYEEEQTKQECHEHWQIFEKKIRLVCLV